MIEIEAPDGTIVHFPADTPHDVMRAAMRKRFPPPNPHFDAERDYSPLDGAVATALQGTTASFADEIAGGMSAVGSVLMSDRGISADTWREDLAGVWDDAGKAYDATAGMYRGIVDEFRDRNPWTAMGVEVAGALPTFAIPGLNVATTGNMIRGAAQGARSAALYGGAYRAGSRDGTVTERAEAALNPASVAFDVGIGAAGGALGERLARIGQRVSGPTGETVAAQRAADAATDAAAFEARGVRPFGPSFHRGPAASVGQQLSETPVIGAPLRQNLDETYRDAAVAAERVAEDISPAPTAESAGAAVQRGLDRFQHADLQDLDPNAVRAAGIDPYAPRQRRLIMSAGAERDAAAAAPVRQQIGADVTTTTRGVQVASAQPLGATLMTRTTVEDLSDDALDRLIRLPSSGTSFATRSEALYERAMRMLPTRYRSNGSINPSLVSATNTRNALGQIDDDIASQIAGQGRIDGDLAERMRDFRAANFSISDLRRIRTEVGRAMGAISPLAPASLNRQQLGQLYDALSTDIEIGLDTLANRAALDVQRATGAARAAAEVQARQAAGALRAFRTADRYTRQGMARMETFLTTMRAQSPEQAARKIVRAGLDGTKGNARLFRNAMRVLRPEERAEFASLVLREMGVVGEARWSPSRFATAYNALSPEARALLFQGENAQAVHELYRIARRLAGVEALANSSRSATNALNVSGLAGATTAVATGEMAAAGAIAASGYLVSLMMSRPAYTRWLTRYIDLRAQMFAGRQGTAQRLEQHVRRFERLVGSNPALLPVVAAIQDDMGETE